MEQFIIVAVVLLVAWLVYTLGQDSGAKRQRECSREFGKKAIKSLIKKSRNEEELQLSLEQVGSIGSALINLRLMCVMEVAEYTTSLIAEKIVEFSEKKSVPCADTCAKVPTPAGVVEDIIHTKKKGQTRRVSRTTSGRFTAKPVRKLKVRSK